MDYILCIDQSTSGTKALLMDGQGKVAGRADAAHGQIVSVEGWVSHDAEEIYQNTLRVVKAVIDETGVSKHSVRGVAVANQRETALVWNRETGRPVDSAIVWQCARAQPVCDALSPFAGEIKHRTGLPLSPYFSAAKIAWLLKSIQGPASLELCAGTMDSYLLYRFTRGNAFCTDVSNASRTQLMNLETLDWDAKICQRFGIPIEILPKICDSNACFGFTDFEGFLDAPIPIHAMMGDSHAALYGQGCHEAGMGKVTYGTGASVMINIGQTPLRNDKGLVTSLAWRMNGKAQYVLEGNINYAGAVMNWVKNDLQLVGSVQEASALAQNADVQDMCYLVPAFTGLGAPYWKSDAKALICGMTRHTGRAEIVRAALDSIAYQIMDVLSLMAQQVSVRQIRADGGPTRNEYLMQFQSDICSLPVLVAQQEELSALGAGFAAGIALGVYDDTFFASVDRIIYSQKMDPETRTRKIRGWQDAIGLVLGKE